MAITVVNYFSYIESRDTSDLVPLYLPQRLYLKPVAKINLSVQLPPVKVHGKSISTWELMEKIRKLAQPETFSTLKVSKTSADVIRFDAELDARPQLERVVSRLDDRTIKLSEYPDALRVRAAEAKLSFPSRHTWDSFFRDAPNMDEMKPGERPDTLHVSGLPVAWFTSAKERREDDAPPSESVFRKVFEKFGRVRGVDVPASDPFRRDMKPHMTGITVAVADSSVFFEGYVQFAEYVAFVRTMDALRGMKLVRRGADGELAEGVDISVDFDRTKHMTDAAVKRRAIVRERLAERQRAREEKEKEERDKLSRRQQQQRLEAQGVQRAQQEREERRKRKQLARLVSRERGEVRAAVAEEERRLVDAQRRLQALRLVEELFRRIEIKNSRDRRGEGGGGAEARDVEARSRVVRRIKSEQEAELDKQRTRLQKAYEGSIVLRAVLETRRPRSRSASAGSSGSPPRAHRVKREKFTSPERSAAAPGAAGMYPGLMAPYGFPYVPHLPPAAYSYQPHPQEMYYGGGRAGGYYPAPGDYLPRGAPRFPPRRARGRALYRGGPRMPYFEGPNASHEYYKYFKRLSEAESAHQQHDDRTRSRSHSRRRSYSRSRSRSRRRRRTRSRSYSRSSRSYSRSRSRSYDRRRRSRSRSRRSRSRSRKSRSRSRRRSRTRSRSRRAGGEGRGKRPDRESAAPTVGTATPTTAPADEPRPDDRPRSKSWSLPRERDDKHKSWSKSPAKEQL